MNDKLQHGADPYPNVLTEKPIPPNTAVDAVLGAATALEVRGVWSPTWITRLRETAELVRWYEREMEEIRRITDDEVAGLHAALDEAGVPQAWEIISGKDPVNRLFNYSTFETVNRVRWLTQRLDEGRRHV